jgi:ribosome-binding ATPase YchF (GTP1/OBG family)
MVHSDIQRGFVRAEVLAWSELVDAGGYAAARERGTLRLEGRDYVVADGDGITVKFTP